jgi:hypothetical protein
MDLRMKSDVVLGKFNQKSVGRILMQYLRFHIDMVGCLQKDARRPQSESPRNAMDETNLTW